MSLRSNVLTLVLLFASSAWGAIIHMSSFDMTDADTGTSTDPLATDWVAVESGAEDDDIRLDTAANHGFTFGGAPAGGTASSSRGVLVDAETGETAAYELPSTIAMSTSVAYAAMSVNVYTAPPTSSRREIARFLEPSGEIGCRYDLVRAGSGNAYIEAYYGSGTGDLQGTSVDQFWQKSCNLGYYWIGCSVNNDCRPPASASCIAGSAYWAELVFRQISAPPNKAACDLTWFGRQQWATTYDSSLAHAPGNVVNFRYGAVGTEAYAMDVYIDDVVIATETDPGHGYVGFLEPTANGTTTNNGSITNCGVGSTYYQCVDDYVSGGTLDGSAADNSIRLSRLGKLGSVQLDNPSKDEMPAGSTVTALEYLTVGRTTDSGGSGTWGLESYTARCIGSACTPIQTRASSITHPLTTHSVVARGVDERQTTGLWSTDTMNEAELVTKVSSAVSGESVRDAAMGAYYRVRKPDMTEGRVLSDHDEGADDGLVTITMIGDSLLTGTATVNCSAESDDPTQTCNQDWACSWDIYKDLPVGGCQDTSGNPDNTRCRTCINRTGTKALSDGAGARCTADVQCPQAAGNPVGAVATCDTTNGWCNDNSYIPCDDDSDCTGWGADCDTAATCEDVCPGGSCPSSSAYGSWGKTLAGKVNVDRIIACGLGGERLYAMLANRWANILTGEDASCEAAVGSGNCTCASSADCAGSGTCSGGICTTGASATCTTNAACTTTVCRFPRPDYVVVLEGANDIVDFAVAPSCTEYMAAENAAAVGGLLRDNQWGFCRANCDASERALACTQDSECSGIAASSICVGATDVNEVSTQGYICAKSKIASDIGDMECSVEDVQVCNVNADCGGTRTCTVNDASARETGFCRPGGAGDCGAGFSYVGGFCRRDCATDGDCTTTTRSGACVTIGGGPTKVCAGRCTCPCAARSCSTDADCATGSPIVAGSWYRWEPRGKCVANACTECGPDICPTAAPYAYAHTLDTLSADKYADMFDWMKTALANLSDSGDGRPILLAVEHPWYPGALTASDACGPLHTLTSGIYSDYAHYLSGGGQRVGLRGIHVIPARTAMERAGKNGLDLWAANDWVHFSVVGGDTISDQIAAYMSTLGACAFGTGISAAPSRYCFNYATEVFVDSGGSDACTGVETCKPCTADTDCGARQVCALKPCTADTDCRDSPDVDRCRTE